MTASVGAATSLPSQTTTDCGTLVAAVDRALYAARDNGLDRLVMSAQVVPWPARSARRDRLLVWICRLRSSAVWLGRMFCRSESAAVTGGIKLVLFDMDNVLCDYDRTKRVAWLAKLAGATSGAREARLFAHHHTSVEAFRQALSEHGPLHA